MEEFRNEITTIQELCALYSNILTIEEIFILTKKRIGIKKDKFNLIISILQKEKVIKIGLDRIISTI